MVDNEQIRQEIEPILNEIVKTLASIIEAHNIPNGIQYGLILKDKGYTLNFMREPRFDGEITQTESENMVRTAPVRVD